MARAHPYSLWILLNLCFLASLCLGYGELDDFHEQHMQMHEERQTLTIPQQSTWWYAQIKHQGSVAYGSNSSYKIWRNVKDWGARGDGIHDDTDAINNATFDGNRCGYHTNCTQQTTTPAIVYFPPGTYLVSRPLIMLYYTQFVGDASNLPVIKGTPNFFGIALLDSDPYLAYGFSWYQNQNNFWRHVRNFILDMTAMPVHASMSGLHWQVAQGTSVQNVIINMAPASDKNDQTGIFMDNGSGGWFEDIVFNGGGTGFFAGNQQWSARNLTFNGCNTAIYQNWNWVFTYKSITINNCKIGIDMTQGHSSITTGSMVLQDSVMNNVSQTGILTTWANHSVPAGSGTLVLDNVNFINTPIAITDANSTGTVLVGNQKIGSFIQGNTYSVFDGTEVFGNKSCYEPQAIIGRTQSQSDPPPKPVSLLDANGKFYERGKTQYMGYSVLQIRSILSFGCSNDGVTDVTTCLQRYLDSILPGEIAYIDHGAYVISDTITIPNNIKIVGEIWPLFMVDGSSPKFSDINNPQVAFRVGQPGDTGAVEMQEIIFETKGPAPGAIMMEWNLGNAGGVQGANTMWDVHWRIGGTNGTLLNPDLCRKTPNRATAPNPSCYGAFLLLHITSTGSVLMANNWGWIADHQLDGDDVDQMNIYNGRGMLVESAGPVWLYGTAFEHSQLYNYNFAHAKEVYMGIIQTETAYMQANPNALASFPPVDAYSDPTFASCFQTRCFKTWGLRIFDSSYIYLYGAGMYSFFENYDAGCLVTSNCQQTMVSIEQSEAIYLFVVNTVGAETMVQVDDQPLALAVPNANLFADTVAVFEYP
ncbi:glycoside hydrolase family 55 protein [Myriangium duriaei CBS 260.36]|uniref:Glycoside hydrolase family 55 protein n=1 Tax=Myriangium duriaei CBS 260.36 TaxID=1168546 RepID=A0A9P4J0Y0_9PEZI|nr:glycoside hydrolase family 55 protein [Myriangium duriaei CBS 260.36]